ncbi:hypothetical protein Tco_1054431 [Tanacetum coccineum]|uniref:Uncharacterized protein n=1 Tax=Tanacetum coccineum TaxID=301880 RepID=A0ABQ5GXN0_9ASTR
MEMEPDTENMMLDEYHERMGQEKVQNGCDIDTSRDRNHESEKEEAQVEDDDGDTYDIWDITVKDVERIKQFFNILDETDELIQPLIPQPIHITPPIDDYVAPTTKSILNELLEDKILNVTMVDKEANFNPTKDIRNLKDFSLMNLSHILQKYRGLTARGWNSRSPRLVLYG